MNNKHVEAFRAVMIAGTVTEASGLLHISQPAVSRLLANLEAELGFPLFSRRRGRLVPTSEGLAFYDEVQRSYIGLAKLAETAKAIKEFRHGQLRIGALTSLSAYLLSPFIGKFSKSFPNVNYQINVSGAERIRNSVASQQLHVGLVSLPILDAAVKSELVVEAPLVCTIPNGHRLAKKPLIKIEDLDQEPIIVVPREYPLRLELEAAFQKRNLVMNVKAESTISVTACELAMQGVGIAVTEPFTPLAHARPRVSVRQFDKQFQFRFAVVTPELGERNRLVDEFIQHLRQFIEAFRFAGSQNISLKIAGRG